MSEYSSQPRIRSTNIECPFCNATNKIKYVNGVKTEYQCHSCYSIISFETRIERYPGIDLDIDRGSWAE